MSRTWTQGEVVAFMVSRCNDCVNKPVKHGHWVHDKDDEIISGYCSVCGWTSCICETDVAGMPYCPNCGAKMSTDGKDEVEE